MDCRSKVASSILAVNVHFINRHGAEAARRAHNPEVTRSKRVVGIFSIWQLYRNC
jgi:hypothetical protein